MAAAAALPREGSMQPMRAAGGRRFEVTGTSPRICEVARPMRSPRPPASVARGRRSREPMRSKLSELGAQRRRRVAPGGGLLARRARDAYADGIIEPIDNNWVENQIRPIALGRNNWLFAGSLRAGKRAAAVMSLIYSARRPDRLVRRQDGFAGRIRRFAPTAPRCSVRGRAAELATRLRRCAQTAAASQMNEARCARRPRPCACGSG